jgi:hypothetical protein
MECGTLKSLLPFAEPHPVCDEPDNENPARIRVKAGFRESSGLRWTFLAKRTCVVTTAPLPPPAPMGLRGVWVVGGARLRQPPARCCAGTREEFCMSKRKPGRRSWLRQSSLALDSPAARSNAGFARRRVDGERVHAAF